jgi:signal recognition particle GTPase
MLKSFVSRLLGMGDITGLLNLFEEGQCTGEGQEIRSTCNVLRARVLTLSFLASFATRSAEKILDQPELYKKITEGTGDFTFRDMYEQFQNLLKLGPLGKVMSMIPGLSNMIGPGKSVVGGKGGEEQREEGRSGRGADGVAV